MRLTHLWGFSGPVEDPSLCILPVLVEGEQASFAAMLDELIWLRDELGHLHTRGEMVIGRDGARLRSHWIWGLRARRRGAGSPELVTSSP